MSVRRDPFVNMDEPVRELGLVPDRPAVLSKRPSGRRTPVRPSEKRRRARQLTITFSDPAIPDRLRALAIERGLMAPDGIRPNVSALVEELLLPLLENGVE